MRDTGTDVLNNTLQPDEILVSINGAPVNGWAEDQVKNALAVSLLQIQKNRRLCRTILSRGNQEKIFGQDCVLLCGCGLVLVVVAWTNVYMRCLCVILSPRTR